MKAPSLLLPLLVALVLTLESTFGMQQVDLAYDVPIHLSTFDGYRFGNNLGLDGYSSFFYSLPTSSRYEQRTASGEVTGEYAFVAPEGDEYRFSYQADEGGYRVESNALPVAPEDTDEVKKAKEEFFAAYQRALELAGSYEDSDSSSEESSEEDYYDSDEESSEEDEDDEDESDEEEEEEEEEEGEEGGEGEEEGEAKQGDQRRIILPFQNLVNNNGFGRKTRGR